MEDLLPELWNGRVRRQGFDPLGRTFQMEVELTERGRISIAVLDCLGVTSFSFSDDSPPRGQAVLANMRLGHDEKGSPKVELKLKSGAKFDLTCAEVKVDGRPISGSLPPEDGDVEAEEEEAELPAPVRAPLTYKNLVDSLSKLTPALTQRFRDERDLWGEDIPSPHVVFGDVLGPYLSELLVDGDERALRQVFDFIEAMAVHSDAQVKEVVSVTVAERLAEDPNLSRGERFIGKATTRLLKQVRERLG